MKPLLFLWITFLISIKIIPTSVFADDSKYTNCKNSFSCGEISGVKFPFWGGDRDDYCGRSELKLSCQENVPKFTINSVTYRILDFDSSTQSFSVARDDYFSTICPTPYRNNTLDAMFRYNSSIVNITLFYGCSPTTSVFKSQSCGSGGGSVYYAIGVEYKESCLSIVIQIYDASVPILNNKGLQDAIKQGFSLQSVDSDKCKTCMDSYGECGYRSGGLFTCFCNDGAHGTSCSDGETIKEDGKKENTAAITGGVSAGVVLVAIALGIWLIRRRKKKITERSKVKEDLLLISLLLLPCLDKPRNFQNDQHIVEFIRNHEALTTKKYSYSDVKKMTNKFGHKLGEGGYGSVYSGRLLDGRLVAVKLLSESKGNGEEFINEVASISRTSHINVVSLLGFCYEGSKRALIYEFMSNGSLDKFTYNQGTSNMNHNLEWKTLYEIAVGIARGLEYLHRGCNMRILHFDIKPHNILLDDKFCPKISDFGLAKVCSRDKSAISMLGTRGTIGYIAPEVFSRNFGRVSYKSDVYSYGMMVLEMVGARNGTDLGVSHTSSEVYFPNHIYKSLEAGHALKVDGVTNEEEEKIFKKMVLVSLWCIQTNPSDRLSMTKVLEMLGGSLQSLPFPPLPFLSSPPRSPPRSDGSYSTTS